MRTKAILIIILSIFLATCAHAARNEFRGLWVHNWRNGLLNPAEADKTIEWAKITNMNAIIMQVRKVGDAYYNSAFEPRATNITGDASYDPLKYIIERVKPDGMEVHAWFNVFRISTDDSQISPSHVASLHPEWLSKDIDGNTKSADGKFLDPGIPEVRSYLVGLIADILGKYEIDGINLDFIRYPAKKWGYNDISVARFNLENGRSGIPAINDPLWCEWRRNQVTETVRAIRAEIDRLKPNVKLSAATITWGACPNDFTKTDAYNHVFQDWRLWMEEGLLDANCVMNYQNPSTQKGASNFAGWLDGSRRWSYGRHVYCGLMIFQNNPKGAVKQVIQSRMKKSDGIVGFAFNQYDVSDKLSELLKSGVFFRPADVPPMSWKSRPAAEEEFGCADVR